MEHGTKKIHFFKALNHIVTTKKIDIARYQKKSAKPLPIKKKK